MKYFFSNFNQVAKKINRSKKRLILFDLDGTLAPIASTPRQAHVSQSTKNLLGRISNKSGTKVGILSGRTVEDAQRKINLPNLIYGGNHGLEIKNGHFHFVHFASLRSEPRLKKFQNFVRTSFRDIPGVLYEDKGLVFGVHYRRVKKNELSKFRARVKSMQKECDNNQFEITSGKKVFEIRPKSSWNKGAAVRFLKKKFCATGATLFIGDDRTDEDAFQVLESGDIGVRVGRSPSSNAEYYVKNQSEVPFVLEQLAVL